MSAIPAPSTSSVDSRQYMKQLQSAVAQFQKARQTRPSPGGGGASGASGAPSASGGSSAPPHSGSGVVLTELNNNTSLGGATTHLGSGMQASAATAMGLAGAPPRIVRSKTMPDNSKTNTTADYQHHASPNRSQQATTTTTTNSSSSFPEDEFASPNAYLERTFSEAVNLLKTPRAGPPPPELDDDDEGGNNNDGGGDAGDVDGSGNRHHDDVDDMAVDDDVDDARNSYAEHELPDQVAVPATGCGEVTAREAVETAAARHAVLATMVTELRASQRRMSQRYDDASRRLANVQGELKRASKECADMRTARRSARAALAEMAHQNARLVQVFVEKKQEVRRLTEELAAVSGKAPASAEGALAASNKDGDNPSIKLELEMLRCELNDVSKARDEAVERASRNEGDAEKHRRQCERLRAELREARHVADGTVHDGASERERWEEERRMMEARLAKVEEESRDKEKNMVNEMAVLKDQLRLARAEARRMPSPAPSPAASTGAADEPAKVETQTVRFLREETDRLSRENARLDRELRKIREEKDKFQSAATTERRRADAERRKAAGNAAYHQGKYKEAHAEYTAALSAASGEAAEPRLRAVLHCNRAAASHAMGKYVEAVADCCAALHLDARYPRAYQRRADAYAALGDWAAAARDLRTLTGLPGAPPDAAQRAADAARRAARATSGAGESRAGGSSSHSSSHHHHHSSSSNSSHQQGRHQQHHQHQQQYGGARGGGSSSSSSSSSFTDHYSVLGVNADANENEVRKAYHRLALRYHPDKVSADDRSAAEHKIKLVNAAYAVLSSPSARKKFDGDRLRQTAGRAASHWAAQAAASAAAAARSSRYGGSRR
ncbi:chaperone protein DnaJ [Pycnococcus provasolii]